MSPSIHQPAPLPRRTPGAAGPLPALPAPTAAPSWVAKAIAACDLTYPGVVGMITALVDPVHGMSDAERVASIRDVLAAQDAAREAVAR